LRDSLLDLQAINTALRKVSDWPRLVGVDALEGTREMLEHAAEIVGATETLAIWENDEEPWVYLASPSSIEVVTRHSPGNSACVISRALAGASPTSDGPGPAEGDKGVASVPFRTEHLNGRVFFTGLI